MEPYVYIIVLNWNGLPDTLACLRSLSNIRYENYRVCVVDNASTDASVATIRSEFPQVEIIENERNLRFAEGNNVGIRHALAQGAVYVLLLNNDTTVDPGLLQALVPAAEAETEVGMVGPKIYYFDQPDLIWSAGGEISFWKGKIHHRGLRQKDSEKFDRVAEVDYLTACALLVKRAVIERVGLLDPEYYIYVEDADWCERARRAGFKLLYVPGARVWHKVSASSGGGMTAFKVTNKVRSHFLFFRRYARWYHWFTLPLFVGSGAVWFALKQLLRGNVGILGALRRGFTSAVGGAGRSERAPAGPSGPVEP